MASTCVKYFAISNEDRPTAHPTSRQRSKLLNGKVECKKLMHAAGKFGTPKISGP
jgi:hypothetical protein